MTGPFFAPAPQTLGEKVAAENARAPIPPVVVPPPDPLAGPSRALARAQRLAVGEKPENARRVLDLSAKLGYTPEFVRENLDTLEAESARDTFDPVRFARESPIAAEWLGAHPTRVVLLGKDYRALGLWEAQARHLAAQFRSGMAQTELMRIGEAVLTGTATPEQRARQAALEGTIADTPDFGVEGFFEGAPGAAAGQIPILGRTLKAAGIIGTAGAAVGAVVGGVVGKTPATVAAGARFGLSFGAAAGAASDAALMEASSAMLDYERIEGMDPETARGAALIAGAINGALETLSLSQAVKLVPGVRELVRPNIRRLLAGPTTRAVLKSYAVQVAQTVGTEALTEGMQSLVTAWSGAVADAATSGRLQSDPMGVIRDLVTDTETWTNAIAEGRVGAQSALVMGAAGGATTLGQDVRRAQRAERSARALEAVATSVGDAKVTEEAPKEAADLLTTLHQSGLSDVTYTVQDWAELWQGVTDETGAPIDPLAVAREVMGTEVAQYEQAAMLGPEAVFRVPMGTWATKLARNPAVRVLAVDFARTTPDAMNRREAQTQTAHMDAVLAELMETIVTAKQEAKPVEETAASLAERVEKEVRAAGRPATEARAAGEVWSRVYQAFAASSGTDATALLAMFNRVRTTSPKAEAAAAQERAELAAYVMDDARYVAATDAETAAYPGERDRALDAEAQAAEDAAAAEAQALGRVKPATTVKGAVKSILTRASDESLVATYLEMRDRVSEADGRVLSMSGDPEFQRARDFAGVGRWEEAQGAYEEATGAAGQWSFRDALADFTAAEALVAKQTPGMQRLAAEMQRRGLDPDQVNAAGEFNAAMFSQGAIPPSDAEVEVAAMVTRQRALIAKTREYLVRTGRMAADEMPIEVGDTLEQAAFHGTPYNFDAFDRLAPRSLKSKPDRMDSVGIWLAETPDEVKMFTRGFDETGQPIAGPVLTVEADPGNVKRYPSFNALLDDFNTAVGRPEWVGVSRLPQGAPYSVRGAAPNGGNIFNAYLREQGYDSIEVSEEKGIDRPGAQTYRAILDESKVTITHRNGEPVTAAERADALNQDPDAPRGRIVFTKDRFAARIDLLQKADPSTFLHESAHFFFTLMDQLAAAPTASETIRTDYATAVAWAGGTVGTPLTVEQEERLARGFEAYLMEGKAPSLELRRVFQQFAAWLTRVYRDLVKLNVQLTPEVRAVFDRMLATEDAIAEAEAAQAREPLIADAQSVMTAPDAERYLVAQAEARAAAEETLRADVMAVITREEKAWWKEARATMREEVEQEVHAHPAYRARQILTTGKLPDGTALAEDDPLLARIDKVALVAMIGEDGVKALPKGVTRAKGGLPPDAAAAALGYANATALVTALQGTAPMRQHIDAVTDERMVAVLGDPMTDGTLPDRAMQAIHQRQRDTVVRLELEHMARENPAALKAALRRIGGRLPTTEAVTARAAAMIASRKVRDIRPIEWQRAEVAASKAAIKAALDGKWEVAFEAKLREQLSLALYRASVEAYEEVATARTKFARVFQSDAKLGNTRDLNYVNAARALLATVGIGRAGKTAAEYLASIEAYDPETAARFRELLATVVAPVADSRDLTLDEFRILTTQVNALWAEAKATKQITVDGRRVLREEAIAAMANAAEGVRSRLAGAGVTRPWELADTALSGLLSARALLTRVEHFVDFMDTVPAGETSPRAWRKTIFEGIRERTTAKTAATRRYFTQFDALLKTLGPMGTARIGAADLAPGWQWKSHAHLLGALLHTGNPSNFDKMLRGRGWDRGQWDAMIRRYQRDGTLTQAHYDAVQGIWNLFEDMKPEAQRVHKAMMGYYFVEVTAEPVETPWGTYRGGYTPASRDPDAAIDARNRAALSEFENAHGFAMPAVAKGFTNERNSSVAPLLLDLKIVKQHIDAVQKFVHLAEPVRDLTRLLQDRDFATLAADIDPTLISDILTPWLRRTSTQIVETPLGLGKVGKVIDAAARHIRSTASMAYMTVNVQNAIENYISLAGLAKLKVPQRHLNAALVAFIRHPVELPQAIADLSPYMNERMTAGVIDVQRSIDTMLVQPNALQAGVLWMREHSQFVQRFTQHQTETVVWWGAYQHAVASGEPNGEAVRLADATTRMTMGGFEAIDVSRIETGPAPWRTLAMFASWFNMVLNLNAGEVRKVQRVTGLKAGMPRLFYIYTFGIFAMVMGSAALRNAFRGEGLPDDEDDDGYLDEWFSWWAEEQFRFGAAMLPVAGNVLQVPVNAFDEKFYNDRLTLSPAISFLESALKGPQAGYEVLAGDPSRADVRNLMQFLALMTGTPAGTLAKPAGYLMDVQSGAAEPTGPIDFTRGLLSGRP